MKKHLPIVLVFLTAALAPGQSPSGVEQRLRADLKFLTSDECEGRGIRTKGIELAADHIQRQFTNAGLRPGGTKGYYQPFKVIAGAKLGTGNRLILKGPLGQTITLQHGKDFGVWGLGGSGRVEAPLVFAGFGLSSTTPKYDDYAGLDVKGKIVVVLSDTPRRGHPFANVFTASETAPVAPLSLRAKVESAKKHEAAGILVVNSRTHVRLQDSLPNLNVSPTDGEPLHLPVAYLKRDLVDMMLASAGVLDLTGIEKQIDADLQPRSKPLTGWTCRFETDVTLDEVPVKNIIGVLEGSGPLAAETVVVGAHYDHVGYAGTTRKLGAKALGRSGPGSIGGVGFPLARIMDHAIHHGADDNASGTSVVMELARRFGADKNRQGRRLVFIAFTAEESGLVGSTYYCRQPTVPLPEITTMVNMDQIGRLQDDKLLVGGLGTAKEFPAMIDRLNKKHGFKVQKESSGTAPTDNASFNARKIPVVWFFTGFHEHYHRPSDRLETLNVPGLTRIVDLVADVVTEVANQPNRPQHLKTGNVDRTKTLWSQAPSTGIVADYADRKEGVLVDEVVKDTPAAKAGLKKGDRLLALAGRKLQGPAEFLTLARTLKAGDAVDVLVERDGKSMPLKLQLISAPAGATDPKFGLVVDLNDIKKGVLVTGVVANGPAARAGLKKGDRLVAISGEKIVDRAGYQEMMRTLPATGAIQVTVLRDGRQQEFRITQATKKK